MMYAASAHARPLRSFAIIFIFFDLPRVLALLVACPRGTKCECTETNHGRNTVTLELNCQGRNLSAVPDWTPYYHFPISYINLSHNNIRSIPERAFDRLVFAPGVPGVWIPRLDIDYNPISVISPHAFSGMQHEELLLRLHKTRLELFPGAAIRKLVNLTDLFFTYSLITDVPNKSFHGLHKLRRIDLTGNRVGFLRHHVFKGLESSAKSLYLNKMDLTEFPSVALRNLWRLWELKLDDNSIHSLHNNLFQGFQTVTSQFTMYLRRNDLTHIAPKAFLTSKFKMYNLHMEHNNISEILFLDDPCSLTFASYAHINLRYNPMMCDCDLFSVLKSGFYDIHGSCVTPEPYANIPWISKIYDVTASRSCKSTEVKTWFLPCMTGSGQHTSMVDPNHHLPIILVSFLISLSIQYATH